MMLNELNQDKISTAVNNKIAIYSAEKKARELACSTRIAYYSGEIEPKVGVGHEKIVTQLCASIADKMSAYIGVNPPDISILSKDISDESQNLQAQTAEDIIKDILESSDKNIWFLEANENGSRLGDGVIATDVVDGIPVHYSINKPQNVTFGWKTDNYKELEWWSYDFGITPGQAMDRFNEEFQANDTLDTNGDNVVIDRNRFSIYALGQMLLGKRDNNNKPLFVRITDFHTMVDIKEDGKVIVPANSNVVLANGKAMEVNEGKAKKLYHFVGNTFPGSPTGVCDFENSAELVTMYEKKLSEEADAVSQSVYHKFITTDNNLQKLVEKLTPNKSQIIKLQETDTVFKTLDLQSNAYNSEPLVKNIMNVIRTVSNLQELVQDQISPNISGKALAYVFQGVVQTVSKKRARWEKILKDLVVDDLFIVTKGTKYQDTFFDSKGNFKFKVTINWPDILESDKSTKIANVLNMRNGQTPLISAYTARNELGVADPNMEDKRVEIEKQKELEFNQALQAEMAQPSEPTGPIMNESMNQPGEGIASSEGNPGGAQTSGMSSQGAANQLNQRQGA